MRLWLAIRTFFAVLFDAAAAEKIRPVVEGAPAVAAEETAPATPAAVAKPKKPAAAVRSDALTLLASLQREARFLDMVQEPLGSYSDAQIGAAARDVLRNCSAVIERLFALRPALDQEEGSAVEVPRGYDPMQFRIAGNVAGEPPFHGKLVHHGWVATRCDLPSWSGTPAAANVVAPIEVEVS